MSLVAHLEQMDLHQLRDAWRERYGAPPKFRSRELLAFALAWRIQSQALGGLDVDARRSLRSRASAVAKTTLPAGAKLTKHWGGAIHEVSVLADGAFSYRGETYKSLSAIARTITGTRWNGPRFFGVPGQFTR